MAELEKWDSFYLIAGGAAGALIGLQFVVITLMADRPSSRSALAGAAFTTPTVAHFSAVLLLSVLLRAPWEDVAYLAWLCMGLGVAGVFYALLTARRIRVQTVYKPDAEDWLSHVLVPLSAYATIAVSGFAAFSHPHEASFGIGGAALLLLFVGIHNAWDAAAYHVLSNSGQQGKDG